MLSFILSGIVILITLAICALIILANGMSDALSQNGISIVGPLFTGLAISFLISASHWLPHISW